MTMTAEKATEARGIDGIEGDRYYSLMQVATFLGTSRWTVHRKVGAGVIPASKAGRSYIVKGSDVMEVVSQRA